MTELRRLLDDDCDELARAMLRAASDDRPPQGSLTAVAAALGVAPALTGLSLLGAGSSSTVSTGVASAAGGAASTGAALGAAAGGVGAASTASSLTVFVVAKYVAIGMASGLVAMGGMTLAGRENLEVAQQSVAAPSPARQANVRASQAVAAHVSPAADSAGEQAAASEAVPVEPSGSHQKPVTRGALRSQKADEPAPAVGATPESAATGSAAAFVDDSAKPAERVEQNKGLTRELALLDRARSALLAGNAGQALGLLDEYRSVRVSMILDPEAEALRILALDRQGQHATASRLAREFIASHPASRQVDSLRALAGRN